MVRVESSGLLKMNRYVRVDTRFLLRVVDVGKQGVGDPEPSIRRASISRRAEIDPYLLVYYVVGGGEDVQPILPLTK